jgi:DNA-binding CsgD family transcriptional regulator
MGGERYGSGSGNPATCRSFSSGAKVQVELGPADYGLSPRERQVVTLVARGASTARIAAALHISEHTVQNHLSHVFDKVGVRDRRALVRRLFLDVLYPSLFG